MNFGRALGISFATGNNRTLREGEVDETEKVGPEYALIGIAILVATMAALISWRGNVSLDFESNLGFLLLAFAPLAVPFVVFWLGALVTGNTRRLPAAFLYLGVTLAVIQAVTTLLASFGMSQTGFVLGLFLAVCFLAARGFLKVGWGPAILVSLLAVGGFLAATFLLLTLPAGQLPT